MVFTLTVSRTTNPIRHPHRFALLTPDWRQTTYNNLNAMGTGPSSHSNGSTPIEIDVGVEAGFRSLAESHGPWALH